MPGGEPCAVMYSDVPRYRWDHPGEIESCGLCPCRERERQKRILEQVFGDAGPRAMYRKFNFKSWDLLPASDREGKDQARALCGLLADGAPFQVDGVDRYGLILSGPAGTTKTGLATCVVKRWLIRGIPALWVEFYKLLDELKSSYSDDDTSTRKLLEAVYSAPFLLVDDLGPGRGARLNEHAVDLVWKLINERYSRLLPTIITTNMSWTEFKFTFDEPLAQRVVQLYHWCPVGGKNMRQEE